MDDTALLGKILDVMMEQSHGWTSIEARRMQTFHVPRNRGSGALAEPRHFTVCEPKQLAEHQDHRHFTGDGQFTEHEDLHVKPLFFHQPSIPWTNDSAESIVTPSPDSDLDDEQLRDLQASPLYLQEREAHAERSQVYHSERESLMSSSSQGLNFIGTKEPVAVFSSQSRLNQETLSDEDEFS